MIVIAPPGLCADYRTRFGANNAKFRTTRSGPDLPCAENIRPQTVPRQLVVKCFARQAKRLRRLGRIALRKRERLA